MTDIKETENTEAPEAKQSGSFGMILAMGGVGLVSAALIVFTYQTTLPRIKENRARFLEKSIFQVLPGVTSKKVFKHTGESGLELLTGSDERSARVYPGYDADGNLKGVAIESQGQGFADVISIIYGYDPACECVVGMKVLDSRETPGLGDKIEKDANFVANFKALDAKLSEDGKSIVNPIVMVKFGQKTKEHEIEAITGATISSRAITNILHKSTAEILPRIRANLKALQEGGK